MNITIRKTTVPACPPQLAAPPSKSDAHRLLILAALSADSTPIRITLTDTNADIDATADALAALGADIRRDASGFIVTPLDRTRTAPQAERALDVGESGSTLRFLIPVIGALGIRAVIRMHGRLPARPLAPLDAVLAAHGVTLTYDHDDPDLLHISGNLTPGLYEIDGGVSSQFMTGLLLALPLLASPSVLRITGTISSAPYLALTRAALRRFSCIPDMTDAGHRYAISPTDYRPAAALAVEGDWSGAAFLLCAGAMTNGVTVTGLPRDTAQGDSRILAVLSAVGCRITWNTDGDTVALLPPEDGMLAPFTVSADDIPDLLPPMAALACACRGKSVITGCRRLKLKESDRLAAVVSVITTLGGIVSTDGEDVIRITGHSTLSGGAVSGFGDHRMVMSAALCALISDTPVTVSGGEAINKSYPGFFDDLRAIGAAYD